MNDVPNGSWVEYRRLFDKDRDENIAFRKEMREGLAKINSRLDKNEGAERVKLVALNLGVPTVVAILVTLLTLWGTTPRLDHAQASSQPSVAAQP